MHIVIIGFGQVASYKYMPSIEKGLEQGIIESFSLIDLDTQKHQVERKVRDLKYPPEKIFFLRDSGRNGGSSDLKEYTSILKKLHHEKKKLKIIITTEVKSHEEYLRFCIENNIDSLVEKPVISPMKGNFFAPELIEERMHELTQKARQNSSFHSVMSLGRYHQLFDDEVRRVLKNKISIIKAPITSLHLRTNSGIWNLPHEYESREDHPYKYGYGMLMHGGYHYIDIITQLLKLNKLVFPEEKFSLTLSTYCAYPYDQNIRIPFHIYKKFKEGDFNYEELNLNKPKFGETDLTTNFCLKIKNTNQVLTLGTLSLEQTSPSTRSWWKLPEGIYNKNGRLPCTDIEINMSTLFSLHARVFKLLKRQKSNNATNTTEDRVEISTRSHPMLLKENDFYTEKKWKKFKKLSKDELIQSWLRDEEFKSRLESHLDTMIFLQKIAFSLQNPGYPITFDFL